MQDAPLKKKEGVPLLRQVREEVMNIVFFLSVCSDDIFAISVMAKSSIITTTIIFIQRLHTVDRDL